MKMIGHEAVRMNCKSEQRRTLPNRQQYGSHGLVIHEDRMSEMGADRGGISVETNVIEALDATGTSWKHIAQIGNLCTSMMTGLKPCATAATSVAQRFSAQKYASR
jgi:hypothetical protein